jgi:hypothetical protein
MGEKLHGRSLPHLLDERLEGDFADQFDDLVPQLLVHGLVAHAAWGSSVHHQWNSPPPSPQSRRFHSRST